jgi:hypothetical protein
MGPTVGAMSAPWCPLPTAARMPSAATTVLPHPTSPCTSRSMAVVPAMSWRISSNAVSCPGVRLKSSTLRSSSHLAVLTMLTPSPLFFSARSRSCRNRTCTSSSSSNASLWRASNTWYTSSGL